MLETGGRLLGIDSGRESEAAREGSSGSLRDPIFGSCGSADSCFLVGRRDFVRSLFCFLVVGGGFVRFVFDSHVLCAVGFLSRCLLVDLLCPTTDGDGFLVVSELDADLGLLVSGNLDLDFVAPFDFGDIGPVGSANVVVTEERGVHVEKGKVIDIVKERSVVDPGVER